MAAIFTKGGKYLASNYHPISMTAIYCNVMKHIIANQLMNHVELSNILYDIGLVDHVRPKQLNRELKVSKQTS